MKWVAYRKVKKAGKYGKRNKAPTESGRVRGRDGTGGPTTLSLGRLAELCRAPARKRAGLSWLKGTRRGKMN